MYSDKAKLLNREAVVRLLDECARQNRMFEASGLLMQVMGSELRDICREYQAAHQDDHVSMLTRFRGLNPTNEQLRKAITQLMELEPDKGIRPYLFFSPRQWLSIFKVLCFLGIMTEGYGSMATMEAYVRTLFDGHEQPRVRCVQDSLTKKNIEAPFKNNLQHWEQHRNDKPLQDYWPIALRFLQILSNECVTECVSSTAVTEVITERN